MQTTTVTLSENLLKMIDERGGARPEAIETDLNRLYHLEVWTLDELKGRFSEDELKFLWLNAVQGFEYEPVIDPKKALINNVATALDATKEFLAGHELDCQRELKNALIDKLKGLTSFQAYTLYAVLDNLVREEVVDMERVYRAFR